MNYGKVFFETYCANDFSGRTIVDVGSQDVNGSLREFCPIDAKYIGVDFVEGKGVDVILTDPYKLPFADDSVDVVVCSSVFEHAEFFWLLLLECLRIMKPQGLLYINAPSNGKVHRYPIDAWRFYPDAGRSMVGWARRNSYKAVLLESFIADKLGPIAEDGVWNDFVAIIVKSEEYEYLHPLRIQKNQGEKFCGYNSNWENKFDLDINSPDYQLILENKNSIEFIKKSETEKNEKIASLGLLIQEKEDRIASLTEKTIALHAHIESIDLANIERNAQIDNLNQLIAERDQQNFGLTSEIQLLRNSTSWRVTKPLRFVGQQIVNWKHTSQLSSVPLVVNSNDGTNKTIVSLTIEPQEKYPEVQQDAAFEVLSGLDTAKSEYPYVRDESKLIAFYLPQYHRIAENSEWWGPGFTEWSNVVKGKPNFVEHYQPHLPREFGFYDLSNVETIREQAELAKLYGVGAFCFYYYWFSGRRILEKPIDNFLSSEIDINYCLCWANENWTRTWDGDAKSVLMQQKYLESDPLNFIASLLPHFRDRRYIQVDGKPMLLVYRAKDIPNVANVFAIWRKAAVDAGFKGLHIAVVDFYDISTPMEVEADALVEFPPHKFNGPQNRPEIIPTFSNLDFKGGVIDYSKVMAQSAGRSQPAFNLYRGIIPSWDNTARRQDTPTIVHGATPQLFQTWLSYLRAYTRATFPNKENNFIFVNAWNEWGEGCHLEPCQKWGLGYLEAVSKSAYYRTEVDTPQQEKSELLRNAARAITNFSDDTKVPTVSIDETVSRLVNVRPVGNLVQKMAFGLRNFPIVFWCGRSIYRFYRKVIG